MRFILAMKPENYVSYGPARRSLALCLFYAVFDKFYFTEDLFAGPRLKDLAIDKKNRRLLNKKRQEDAECTVSALQGHM